MSKDYIRIAKDEDIHLIMAYFEQALAHYEEVGEILAMQDIKYFIQNIHDFQFVVLKESTTEVTYLFEFPETVDGKRETGTIIIPLQNN